MGAVRSVDAGGTTVVYQEEGSGPLALFVHGAGLDHTMWRHQLQALGGRRRCVAIDVPGYGQSPPGQLDLAEVIGRLGHRRADVVGHSWGGHEVLALWRRRPDRVRSLALLGVMFSADSPHAKAARAGGPKRPVPISRQRQVVRSISVPLLVATGSDDASTPAALCRKLARANPAARFVEVAGAGHMSPVERPEEISLALRALWSYDPETERRSTERNRGR